MYYLFLTCGILVFMHSDRVPELHNAIFHGVFLDNLFDQPRKNVRQSKTI